MGLCTPQLLTILAKKFLSFRLHEILVNEIKKVALMRMLMQFVTFLKKNYNKPRWTITLTKII